MPANNGSLLTSILICLRMTLVTNDTIIRWQYSTAKWIAGQPFGTLHVCKHENQLLHCQLASFYIRFTRVWCEHFALGNRTLINNAIQRKMLDKSNKTAALYRNAWRAETFNLWFANDVCWRSINQHLPSCKVHLGSKLVHLLLIHFTLHKPLQ